MANKLIFKDAEVTRDAIMASQKKEIAALYESWADEIGERAKYFSHKSTASAPVSERYYRELQKQLRATSQDISNEVYSKIKKNIYTISDAVIADNVKWLESFGFDKDGLNAAFSYVPDEIVRNLITGQIYDSGWSLSSKIWSDNEKTLKDIYQVMAKGLAENKPIYEIAKDLESYVRPSARLSWNLRAADGVKIYKKQVDYNAQRLARTLVQHGYQQSFVATTQKNPFITEYIWRSNGSRVCELCASRDGVHYKKTELPMDHPNGMCTMEPVVSDDMVDQLADWFNSPDGTYPEIDEFAGNFGYQINKTGNSLGEIFKEKFGNSIYSDKMKSALGNDYDEGKKLIISEFKKNGYESTHQFLDDYYSGNIKSDLLDDLFKKKVSITTTSEAGTVKDFIDKYGMSTKSPSAWYNSLTPIQKAEAKALKESSGLTWNQWYEKYVYKGGSAPTVSKAAKTTKSATKVAEATVKTSNNIPEYNTWINGFTKQTESYMLNKEKTSMKHLSVSEKAGIKAYSGNSFEAMNSYLRYLQQGFDEADAIRKSYISESQLSQLKSAIKGLDKTKLDEDLVLRRGSSIGDIAGLFMQGDYRDNKSLLSSKTAEELNDMFQGAVGNYGAFTSTSSIWDRGFTGDVEYIIYAPKGTSASSIMSISRFGTSEGETLLNAGTTVRCVKIEESDGHKFSDIRVFLEIITK